MANKVALESTQPRLAGRKKVDEMIRITADAVKWCGCQGRRRGFGGGGRHSLQLFNQQLLKKNY